MTLKEKTADEIILALEMCDNHYEHCCTGCPYEGCNDCAQLLRDARNLIIDLRFELSVRQGMVESFMEQFGKRKGKRNERP